MLLGDVDWERWEPRDRATLVFAVFEGREVLLIRKKRGLGAGKMSGPGGRIEPGETPRECAARETREETGLEVVCLEERGEVSFQFADGYSIHVHIFLAPAWRGRAVETDEAVPGWYPLGALPFDEMWEDDRLWLPLLLEGQSFSGRFLFDGDRMIDGELVQEDGGATREEGSGTWVAIA